MSEPITFRDRLKLCALALCMLAGGIDLWHDDGERVAKDKAAQVLCLAKAERKLDADMDCL